MTENPIFSQGSSAPDFTIEFWLQVDFGPEFKGRGFTIWETRTSRASPIPHTIFMYSAGKFWLLQTLTGSGLYPLFQLPYEIKSGEPIHIALTSDNLHRVGNVPLYNRSTWKLLNLFGSENNFRVPA